MYVELSCLSNFSFLQGASHADELMAEAAALGYDTLGVADINSLAGIVRAHAAARAAGIRLIVGARLQLQDPEEGTAGLTILCYPKDRAAYGRLAQMLTDGHIRSKTKGECHLQLVDICNHRQGQIFVLLPPEQVTADFIDQAEPFCRQYRGQCYLAAAFLYRGDDHRRLAQLADLARAWQVPLLACNDVHYHNPARRPLQDVLSCIRHHCTIYDAGYLLYANTERHLKPVAEMQRLFAGYPDAIAQTQRLAEQCQFSLDELRYEYPVEPTPVGYNDQQWLEKCTWDGAKKRYGDHLPEKVQRAVSHELALIAELNYAPYFLTVYDIVAFAERENILCQGRGSAANSAVCYCLGITAVDPDRVDLLFERFISAERNEPPDIDVDFQHERREEVIQYIYKKYGRHRAGIAATVITYRAKSAIREVGKALGLSEDLLALLSENSWSWGSEIVDAAMLKELGLDSADPHLAQAIALAREIIGFPRHLSQHVGGFVITKSPLSHVVPIENGAMADRTFISWDKDDLDALGILKIDCLGLGMLTCLAKGFELLAQHHQRSLALREVPAEDPAVYDMLCQADSIGVFQVESRAQMTMLPRLKPRSFYDLVVEVAIVRPGPIQGDMVHPYLRRRNGEEAVIFPSEELRDVLGKTMGVPLFQEQAMKIAIVAAGFTPSEADQLRRAMATFRRTGTIHNFHQKMVEGMAARGYDRDFAERCFKQIEGFGEYGFPESHAASFALLVYVSAWMKCHYPAAFACALLNSQPMGFYAPAQIVRDAQEHDVQVHPVDINHSDWDCTLEESAQSAGAVALRLGFRQVKGLKEADMARLVEFRDGGYQDPTDMQTRLGLSTPVLERLADADAWRSVGLDRRQALWAVKGLPPPALPLFAAAQKMALLEDREPAVPLPKMALGEHVVEDYRHLRLSLKAHPCQLLRPRLTRAEVAGNDILAAAKDGQRLTAAGLVLVRQRPGSAKGVIFMTLEDEHGVANVVVWPPLFERFRRVIFGSRLLVVRGVVQREGPVIHLVAKRLWDVSDWLSDLLEDPKDAQTTRPADHRSADHRPADHRKVLPKGRRFH